MSKQVLMGLAKIEYADLEDDGSIGSTWTCYGDTADGSCTWEQDDAEETDVNAEEVSDPIFVLTKKGKARINYQQTNFDADALVYFCGGTKSEDGDYLAMPDSDSSSVTREKALRITFLTGHAVTFSHVNITAKLDGAIGKAENTKVSVKATILAPAKTGLPVYRISGFKD